MIGPDGRADESVREYLTELVNTAREQDDALDTEPVMLMEFFIAAAYRGFSDDGDFSGVVVVPSNAIPHHLTGLARKVVRTLEAAEDFDDDDD